MVSAFGYGAGECLCTGRCRGSLSVARHVLPARRQAGTWSGSQGVTLVETADALYDAATGLIEAATFGDILMVEEFLDGDEMTVTVMPPASPRPDGSRSATHWALRPVYRFDQRGGVAPYNGDVPVTANSIAIDRERLSDPAIAAMIDACVTAAALVDARATIRIDCRADGDGLFKLFDLNMKPNMTGPGRPKRDDQDCLSAISARADGWSYSDLCKRYLLHDGTGRHRPLI
ncbi:hypothetical protein P0F65_22840 [Sphingomonas sp. I4]